jgi:hypothetical protein
MAVYKIFRDSTTTLEVFKNTNDMGALKIYEHEDDIHDFRVIELDSDDLTELITELQFLKKQLDNG